MKKLIILALTFALILSLCACGAEDIIKEVDPADSTVSTEELRTNLDSATAYVEAAVDTSGMTAQDVDDQGTTLYKSWLYDSETVNDKIPMEVEIDGKTITINKTTVAELKEMGFTIELDSETIEPNLTQGFTINKDGKYCNLSVYNDSDKAVKADGMTVCEFQGSTDEFNLEFIYSGLKKGSTLEEVIKALGTPHMDINICSDSLFGTTIDLDYFCETVSDGISDADTLSIHLVYDAEKNTATLGSLQLHHQIND